MTSPHSNPNDELQKAIRAIETYGWHSAGIIQDREIILTAAKRSQDLESIARKLATVISLVASKGHLGVHQAHWDNTMQRGIGCPICIDQREVTSPLLESLELSRKSGLIQ